MNKNFIDAHCHLTDYRLANITQQLIEEANQRGIYHFVQGGIDPDEWQIQEKLAKSFPNSIHKVFGIHPWRVDSRTSPLLETWLSILETKAPTIAAIGEIGLDFHVAKDRNSRSLQIEILQKQLDIAHTHQKPVVTHIVKAHNEVINIVKNHTKKLDGIVIHGFLSSKEIAKQYIECGSILSLGPRILNSNVDDLIKYIPDDHLVIESDAPSYRYTDPDYNLYRHNKLEQASPCIIEIISRKIAKIKNKNTTDIMTKSYENMRKLILKESNSDPQPN